MRAPHAVVAVVLAMAVLRAAPAAALAVSVGPSYTGSTSADTVGTTVPVPDIGAAVGPEHFVELLNGRWAVYDKQTGAPLASSSHLAFWEQAGIPGPIYQASDPRIRFDAEVERWYATTVRWAPNATQDDRLLFAVSRGPDPAQGWDAFQLDVDPGAVNWLEVSNLGFDADAVVLAVQRLGAGTGSVDGTAVVALPKADLLADPPTIADATVFLATTSETGFEPQPAVDLDGSGLPLPLLSGNFAPFGVLLGSRVLGPIAAPSLDPGLVIAIEAALPPPDADQPGDKLSLETGGRSNASLFSGSVVIRNGSLWAVQGINVDGRAAIRWFEIDPDANVVLQDGVVAHSDLALHTASIAVNELDHVVIGMTGSSENVFPTRTP
jgi:hypothetical protein